MKSFEYYWMEKQEHGNSRPYVQIGSLLTTVNLGNFIPDSYIISPDAEMINWVIPVYQ